MALRNDTEVALQWGKMPTQICAMLPWEVELKAHVVTDGEEAPETAPLNCMVSVRAIKATVALEENFAECKLGKWKVTCEAHYDYGFDEKVTATGHPSMFLKGGNDSNFGMVMTVLPSKSDGAFEDDSEPERPELDTFQPQRVTFYVRTDSPNSDSGHFILGESNEVNRRVAQFQFTKEGNMGLLGSGGSSYGAVPYLPHVWYRIDLTFNWADKEVDFYVDCKLAEASIPFRRPTSSYIGACALGNRDRCTTWFDSFAFTMEEDVAQTRLQMLHGRAAGWCLPVKRDEELWLHAVLEPSDAPPRAPRASEGGAGDNAALVGKSVGAFVRYGPFTPVSGREVAQRSALNETALAQMRSMLDDELTADVCFRVGGETMYAHRCVLAARCEALKAMLSSGLAEGQPASAHRDEGDGAPAKRRAGAPPAAHATATAAAEGGASSRAERVPLWTVTVKEARPAVFRKMLEFIYAGAIDVEAEMATELLALADQYMLHDLKVLCGFGLRKSISVETVCRIIQSADRFDCEGSELKQHCLAFILHNYSEVVGCPMWEELAQSPHLLVEITRALALSGRAEHLGQASLSHLSRKRTRD